MTKRKRTPRLPRWVMASFDDMVQAAQKHANSITDLNDEPEVHE